MPQPKRKYQTDPLATFRKQLKQAIEKNYRTVEEFCQVEDFSKSTMSRLLNTADDLDGKRTEYQIYTLYRIAEAVGKKLVIKME